MLVQRHVRAQHKIAAERDIRRMDTSDAMARFDNFEERIERIESESELVNFGRKPTLEDEFRRLEGDEGIDKELEELKKKRHASN
jgi:phage shock protein A